MITNLFKQIRHQWRRNLWIVLELFLVFVLMWCIVDYFSTLFITSRTPVGFDITDTYKVTYSVTNSNSPNYIQYEEGSEEPGLNLLRMVEHIRRHPDVEVVCYGQWYYPYCQSNMSHGFRRDSLELYPQTMAITPEYFQVFRVSPFGNGTPEQLSAAFSNGVVVLTRETEKKFFHEQSGTGQILYDHDSTAFRVTGVANDMKPYIFRRIRSYIFVPLEEKGLMKKNDRQIWNNIDICFRTRPGHSGKEFAEAFKKEMKPRLAIGNYTLAAVTPFNELEDTFLDIYGVYRDLQYKTGFAIFFLVNIFLGVIGTFWLRIEKRRGEIGLRMAVGSSRKSITGQMLAESLLLFLIAVIPALIVCANLVAMDYMSTSDLDFTAGRFMLNTFLTIALLVVTISLATWYPARRSASIQPAEALHYE